MPDKNEAIEVSGTTKMSEMSRDTHNTNEERKEIAMRAVVNIRTELVKQLKASLAFGHAADNLERAADLPGVTTTSELTSDAAADTIDMGVVREIVGFRGTASAPIVIATAVVGETVSSDDEEKTTYRNAGIGPAYFADELDRFAQEGKITVFSDENQKTYQERLRVLEGESVPLVLLCGRMHHAHLAELAANEWAPAWEPVVGSTMFFALAPPNQVGPWADRQSRWFMDLARQEMARYTHRDAETQEAARQRAEAWTESAMLAAMSDDARKEAYALRAFVVGRHPKRGNRREAIAIKNLRLQCGVVDQTEIDQLLEIQKESYARQVEQKPGVFRDFRDVLLRFDEVRQHISGLTDPQERDREANLAAQRCWPTDPEAVARVNELILKEKDTSNSHVYIEAYGALSAIAAQPQFYKVAERFLTPSMRKTDSQYSLQNVGTAGDAVETNAFTWMLQEQFLVYVPAIDLAIDRSNSPADLAVSGSKAI